MTEKHRPNLTPDQIELLEMCWRLESTEDKVLARALGISVGAYRGRMRRVMKRLGAETRPGPVIHAARLGLISAAVEDVARLPYDPRLVFDAQTGTNVSLDSLSRTGYSTGTFGAAMTVLRPVVRREGKRMGMTVRYTVANGEIIAETRNGVRSLYVPDPQGNTIALFDANQNKTDTWVYWPFGEVKTRTGTTATPFQFGGTLGYYQDSSTRSYVRSRHLDKQKGRWNTSDPLGIAADPNLYRYAMNNPTSHSDPSGLFPCWLCWAGAHLSPGLAYLCYKYCSNQGGPPKPSPVSCSDWGKVSEECERCCIHLTNPSTPDIGENCHGCCQTICGSNSTCFGLCMGTVATGKMYKYPKNAANT